MNTEQRDVLAATFNMAVLDLFFSLPSRKATEKLRKNGVAHQIPAWWDIDEEVAREPRVYWDLASMIAFDYVHPDKFIRYHKDERIGEASDFSGICAVIAEDGEKDPFFKAFNFLNMLCASKFSKGRITPSIFQYSTALALDFVGLRTVRTALAAEDKRTIAQVRKRSRGEVETYVKIKSRDYLQKLRSLVSDLPRWEEQLQESFGFPCPTLLLPSDTEYFTPAMLAEADRLYEGFFGSR